MYQNTSKEFNSIIEGDGRTFYARMVYGDEILNRSISIKLTSQANEDTNTISIGGAVSSFIEVSMEKPDTLLTGKEYSFEIGLMAGEAMEWVPMGIFTPQKPKESDGIVTFTAYDRMVSKLSGAYFTDITGYPVDGKVILQEIATKTGIPLGNLDDLPDGVMVPMRTQTGEEGATTTKPFDGYTYREAVKYLAQMYGKFATFNRNGELEFRWYTESGFTTNRLYSEPESSESVYTLQKITCTVGGNTLTSGSGITGISIENPVMTQEILNNVFAQIGGMEYLPTTCSFFGDIRLDLGDIVTVQGRAGIERKVPVMSLSVDFDGGIITDIGSYGNTEAEESQTKGPTATALDRVYTDLFLVREVLANKVSTDTLEANYATIKQLDAVSARIDKIASTEITTEYLEANYTKTKDLQAKYATIDLANVKVESVQDLFVNVGLIKDATIVDGHITGYLDAVSINAESIKAGTLSIDRLVLNGTEDSLIFALNNIGELTSTHCDTLDGGLITERTITAEHIVTGAITANEIASETITADKINVADLFAQDITATGSITGAKLYGSYIETTSGKIGGFDIGSTYLANNTTELGTTANSVYVGTDGISCGTSFKVTKAGALDCANINIQAATGNNAVKINSSGLFTNTIQALNQDRVAIYGFCGGTKDYCDIFTFSAGTTDGTTYHANINSECNTIQILKPIWANSTLSVTGSIYEGGTALSKKYMANGIVPISSGGTGASTLAGAATNLFPTPFSTPEYIFTMGSSGYGGGGGYTTITDFKTALGLGNYYTATQIDSKINAINNTFGNYLPLSGGTLSGTLVVSKSGSNTAAVRAYNDTNTIDLRAGTSAGLYHNNNSGYGTAGWVIYINTSGTIKTNTTSDKRLKNYISDLSEVEAGYLLQEVNPILFTYKADTRDTQKDISCGFYAQDIRDTLINHDIGYRSYLLIHDNESEGEDIYDINADEESVTYGLDYSKLTPVLWKGWQIHQSKLDALEKRVETLEKENTELKQKIKTLEA